MTQSQITQGLSNKVVLISGSTKGIGRAIAEQFVSHGAQVIVHGRNPDQVTEVHKQIQAYAGVSGDLATANGADDVLHQLQSLKPVDVLVNNAGIFEVADFFEIDDAKWQTYFETNVLSAVRLCRGLMQHMLKSGHGRVINISSEAGIKPLPQMIHYSVSKTALIGLSRGLAELCKGTHVTVNSLLPGPTWTEGVDNYFQGLAAEAGKPMQELIDNYFKDHEPTSLIQRFITVEEVAQACVFLAENGAVNGSSLRVEGGIIRSL